LQFEMREKKETIDNKGEGPEGVRLGDTHRSRWARILRGRMERKRLNQEAREGMKGKKEQNLAKRRETSQGKAKRLKKKVNKGIITSVHHG